jgi:fatty-acyl-CoA synthase
MRQCITEMNMKQVTIAYGMTETSPIITQTSIHDSVERRVMTVGRAFPHTEVKIVDSNNRIVPLGQQGELCARGYLVMAGYWNDADKTADAIDKGGWMHTGDLATMDEEGYFNIVGRIKDMVIRGGENIYPREIEEFLYQHPKVEAVQIFGVPCPKFGEELCAWIKLKNGQTATEEEIREHCKGQIAHYKIPKHVRFVNEFPMTVTGKVQKFVMRDSMIKDLGLTLQKTA